MVDTTPVKSWWGVWQWRRLLPCKLIVSIVPRLYFLFHVIKHLHYYFCLSSVPLPSNVTVTVSVGTIIAGSSLNLTCTVELSPAVDIPVTVDTVWSGPSPTTVTTTNLMMESLTRYLILGRVNEARNGSYICQATVSSSSEFTTGGGMMFGSTTITIGMYYIYLYKKA